MTLTIQTERIFRPMGANCRLRRGERAGGFPVGVYALVPRTLTRLDYRALDEPSNAPMKRYLKATGYSHAQLMRPSASTATRCGWSTAATATNAGPSCASNPT